MKSLRRGRRAAAIMVTAGLLLAATMDTGLRASPMTPVPGDPVKTADGLISGTLLPSGVKAYLGIPYAKPPTQSLRWKPPQPYAWNGIWNADRKMPECMQVLRPHNINHYFGEEATSEDCLYMNIWAPPGATATAHLPVIVFIYGGGGTIGSSGMPLYDGAEMAKRGAVFVNFNYRVGLLGFMAHPELSKEQNGHSGNYGYLDQNAALKWIHENIGRFGGDPAKVVVIGQSFGAGSVAAQLFSPLSKGLFRGAVMSSACNFTTDPMSLAEAENVGLAAQKALGSTDLDDMRQVPADRILALQSENQVGRSVQGVRSGPDIDGYFLRDAKAVALKQHLMNDVAIIASSNRDDLDTNMNPIGRVKTVAEYHAVAQKLFGKDAATFLRLYPVKSDADVVAMAHTAAREMGFERSSRTCAQLQARYNTSPAYIDLFSRVHPYQPGVKIADQDPVTVGVYHTADIPYWFGTLDAFNLLRQTRAWTPWDRHLSDMMMDSLIAFARTGNPNTAEIHWPAWKQGDERLMVFGDHVSVQTLNTRGMDWLASHAPQDMFRPPAPPTSPRD